MQERQRTVVGVDGRRGGWAVAVVSGTPGRATSVRFTTVAGQSPAGAARTLALARDAGADAVGVDCPVGLPETSWRPVDLAAKRRLGRAHARVFLAPPRAVLAEPTYADARRTCREVMSGAGLSAQTYGLRGVVLALDEVLLADEWARAHVVEVHPELSFVALAAAAAALPPKRTAEGRRARLAALATWCPADDLGALPDGDDHLDALAAAWSAMRWAAGEAEVLGGDRDAAGLPMRVVV